MVIALDVELGLKSRLAYATSAVMVSGTEGPVAFCVLPQPLNAKVEITATAVAFVNSLVLFIAVLTAWRVIPAWSGNSQCFDETRCFEAD